MLFQNSLEALESEQKARSEVDWEVLVLRGQVLGTEETNARLREQVTRQEEGLSILENTCLGRYLFRLWLMPFFLLSFASFLTLRCPSLLMQDDCVLAKRARDVTHASAAEATM